MKSSSVFLFALLLFSPIVRTQELAKTMNRFPDTGQKISYTDTFGEDSDYSINPPSYSKHDDGTATDLVTGLQWQISDGGEMTYEHAILYADTITLGGFSDWRLPTPLEAYSILNHGRANPAVDITVFASTGAEYWWTSLPQHNDPLKVWCTNGGGGIGNHQKKETISAGGTKKFHCRVVRDIIKPIGVSARYINNGNGIITDNLTDLQWKAIPLPDSISWEQALQACENLVFENHNDWRLPNIKELQSLSSQAFSNPSIDPMFNNAFSIGKYWSSTSLPNQTQKAWYLDTRFGITTYALKTDRLLVAIVRSAKNTSSCNDHITQTSICSTDHSRITITNMIPNSLIIIADLHGTILYKQTIMSGDFQSPLLQNGLYSIQITHNENTESHLCIINN